MLTASGRQLGLTNLFLVSRWFARDAVPLYERASTAVAVFRVQADCTNLTLVNTTNILFYADAESMIRSFLGLPRHSAEFTWPPVVQPGSAPRRKPTPFQTRYRLLHDRKRKHRHQHHGHQGDGSERLRTQKMDLQENRHDRNALHLAVGLIAEHINGTASKKPRVAAVARLADPKLTNALLLSPETSRVVASRPALPETGPESPSKPPRAAHTKDSPPREKTTTATTTATILEEACAHLIRVDPRMKPLIEKHHCRIFSPEGLAEKIDPFESLCSGVISQQVSGAAAKSIKAKFVALFDDDEGPDGAGFGTKGFPHPSQVVAMPMERLRTAGLSQRKAEYITGLAEKFTSGELGAQMLAEAPYEEVLEKLIAVRGLGRWSVEMFACFALKRMDVFSLGDLGVQRGMAAFMGRDIAKLKAKGGKWKYMSEKEMLEISERFAPYRSVFMWYMWRVEETDISMLE
ncbi:DNA glycosylase [Sodiomyces alkalinus F11]|uniref:DNA glycosylase n=1 Tax=Sodiomyces alkalinus (strain CBS 110278 / VKM F-3762 / F11) TaxID=1314773 RepID=A0A3N2Q406_SODAK|nr:DNA glycosylase [Sodiomyces alkalinus F11]ROT41511.1 DNA glycosylase [Sodiomyces alkalinus F11]